MRTSVFGITRRRSAALIAGATVLAIAIAGCSSSSNPAATSTTTSAAPSTSAAAASASSSGAAASSSPSAAAGSSSPSAAAAGKIIVGSANFTESELLANIYAGALKAKGLDASTHLDIGAREVYLKAMEDGSINLMPEYTGNLLAYYDKTSTVADPAGVYTALQKALPSTLLALTPSQAEDQDSVAVTADTAKKYNLTSIADLVPVAGQMTLGGSSEWQTRADGPPGMKKIYGLTFGTYKVLDSGGPLSVKGLSSGLVQASDIFTTDPAIKANNFVVLKDPKNLFTAQQVVPLIAKSVASPAGD